MDDKILLAHLKSMKGASADLHRFFREAETDLGSAMDFSLLYIDYSIERLEDLILGRTSAVWLEDSFRSMESSATK